jgi:hypothetical protein
LQAAEISLHEGEKDIVYEDKDNNHFKNEQKCVTIINFKDEKLSIVVI